MEVRNPRHWVGHQFELPVGHIQPFLGQVPSQTGSVLTTRTGQRISNICCGLNITLGMPKSEPTSKMPESRKDQGSRAKISTINRLSQRNF